VKKQLAKTFTPLLLRRLVVAILVLTVGVSGLLLVSSIQASRETLQVEWQQYLPGIGGRAVIETSKRDYLIISENVSTKTESEMVSANQTTLASKVDYSGNLIWTKEYSLDSTKTSLNSVLETDDGDYVLAGTRSAYGQQLCLVKIDSQGNIQWNKTYAGIADWANFFIEDIIQTEDKGYALIGYYMFLPPSKQYLFLVKTDDNGNLQWSKTINTGSYPSAIYQTPNQGYVILGSQTYDGQNPTMYEIIKINAKGDVGWHKKYGGTGNQYTAQSSSGLKVDDGYIIAGSASAKGESATGWIVKTGFDGNMMWDKTCSYNGFPSNIESISQANNGNLMFVGHAVQDGGASGSDSITWIAQVDETGNVVGQLGINMGNHSSSPYTIIQTSDNGNLFVGARNNSTCSLIDKSTWLVKIANFQSTQSWYWLALKMSIIASMILLEILIAVRVLKEIKYHFKS
jgi:hypothetical protein